MELRRIMRLCSMQSPRGPREEIRGAFVASALEARQEVARYGQVMEAADVHKWLLARAAGGKAARPRARKLLK
jgi:hypothetical protein